MATFKSNISENDVSKLCSGKSISPILKKLLKKSAKGESDKKLFKLGIGMPTKSIDVMYLIVGILILGIKNRSVANVHGALNDAKPTLNEFLALVYLGDGNKIYNYLKSSKGQWFFDLVSALFTSNEKIHNKLLRMIRSVRMMSKNKRKLFSNSLKNLKTLMSKIFPGFTSEFSEFYEMAANSQAMNESDSRQIRSTNSDRARDERDEKEILNCLGTILRENGCKTSVPIEVHVFRSDSTVWNQLNNKAVPLNNGEPLYEEHHFLYLLIDDKNPLRFFVKKEGSFSRLLDGKYFVGGGHQAVAKAIYRFLEDNGYLVTSSKELGRQARNAVIDLLTDKGLTEETINKLQLLVLSEVSAKRYGYEKLENDSSGKLWVRKQSNGAFSVAIVLFGNSEEKEAYAKTRDIKSVSGIDKVINSIIEFVESHFYLDAEQITKNNISEVLRKIEVLGCHKSLMNILDLQVMEGSSLERLGYEKLNNNKYLWFNERNDGKIHLAFMWSTHEFNPDMYDPNGQLTDSFKNELAKLIFDYVNSSDQAYEKHRS